MKEIRQFLKLARTLQSFGQSATKGGTHMKAKVQGVRRWKKPPMFAKSAS
jgi:hypothetical protein